jgi:beta-lactamase regulating signal transducer with metallopeptidase domain
MIPQTVLDGYTNLSPYGKCIERRRILIMYLQNRWRFAGSILLALSLLILPCAVQVFAQSNSSTTTSTQPSQSSGSGSSSSQTSTTTTTTKSTTPTETQRTTTTTWVDPVWIAVGAVALIAILAIVIFSARGRSRDTVATVHERETVVKRD